MQLLDSYLKGVKRCLPRAQAADIIKELSDDLRSQLEEKESALGRPMTDEEVAAFLMQHGDPMAVARRYRQDSPSLTIGWELIGPELFPMYVIILCVNLVITVTCLPSFSCGPRSASSSTVVLPSSSPPTISKKPKLSLTALPSSAKAACSPAAQ